MQWSSQSSEQSTITELEQGGGGEQQHLGRHDVSPQLQAQPQEQAELFLPEHLKTAEDVQEEASQALANEAHETLANEAHEALANETHETLDSCD